jgi:hypothetical protein
MIQHREAYLCYYFLSLFFFFLFGSIGVWTQGLELARQVSTTWFPPPVLCALLYFSDGVLLLPVLALDQDSTSTSCIAGITDIYHHTWVLLTFAQACLKAQSSCLPGNWNCGHIPRDLALCCYSFKFLYLLQRWRFFRLNQEFASCVLWLYFPLGTKDRPLTGQIWDGTIGENSVYGVPQDKRTPLFFFNLLILCAAWRHDLGCLSIRGVYLCPLELQLRKTLNNMVEIWKLRSTLEIHHELNKCSMGWPRELNATFNQIFFLKF